MSILSSLGLAADTTFNKTNVDSDAESGQQKYAGLENQLGAQANQFTHQSAPMAQAAVGGPAVINNGQSDATRMQQNQLVGQLQAQAAGTGPSLASGILKQGTDRTLAGQAALAATQGASNPALAQRQLAGNAIVANQQLAQASAQQRMQDQINAQNQLGGVLSGVRGQDQSQAFNQAQLNQQSLQANLANQQQVNIANQGAQLGVQQNNAQNALGFGNLQGSTINADVSGQQFVGQQAINQDEWQQQQQAAQAQANAAAFSGLVGGAIAGAGSMGASYLMPKK